MEIERQLLFAALAVQLDIIDAAQLADACIGWAARRDRSLVELLLERGWLSDADRTEVDRLLERRLGSTQAGGGVASTQPDGAGTAAEDPGRTVDYVAAPARFALQGLHAEGGLGQVWRARDRDLNREVALKRIKPPRAADPEARRRFVREAQVTGQLEHPGIVPVYELGRYPGSGEPYYAMKLVRGRTLKEAVAQYHRGAESGRLDPVERRRLLGALLDVGHAVAYAHARGVLHRDLKPENVVLGAFGEVVVLDWGLAQLRGAPAEPAGPRVELVAEAVGPGTTAGKIVGSIAYMAPEQARGDAEALDERTDVYGLGAILFEILAGRPPHAGAPAEELLARIAAGPSPRPREVRPDVPESLEALCVRALAHDPADRFPAASRFVAELEAWLADEPVLTYHALVAGFARLVAAHPTSANYLDQLARCRLTLGLVLDGIGRPAQAEAAFREAITDYERLNAMDGALPHHRADLATARSHLARVLGAGGHADQASSVMRDAIADYEHYARLHPPAGDETPGIVDVYLTLSEAPLPAPRDGTARGETTDAAPGSATPAGAGEETLRSRLTILRTIARGGLAEIRLAVDRELGREVVVKPLARALMNDERALRRFLREAQISAQLEHPGIVPVYGLGYRSGSGQPYMVMRLIRGETLQAAIASHHAGAPRGDEGLALARLLSAFASACDTLAYAHARGVIHRDVKPSNLMLGKFGETYVLDWALAELIPTAGTTGTFRPVAIDDAIVEPGAEGLTLAGTVVGTPAYMAPEQALGMPTADPRLDIYGLGATLFTILTGTHPYRSGNIVELLRSIRESTAAPRARSINPRVPERLDAIAARAMARDPAGRYPTADALGADVRAWLDGHRAPGAADAWHRRIGRRLRGPRGG